MTIGLSVLWLLSGVASALGSSELILGQPLGAPAFPPIPPGPSPVDKEAELITNVTRARLEGELEALRSAQANATYDSYLLELTTSKSGRGIIVVAGGQRVLINSWVLLSVLRKHLNCTLPVELYYQDASEVDDDTLAVFNRTFYPFTARDASSLPGGNTLRSFKDIVDATAGSEASKRQFLGWALKAYALWKTSFRHAMLLDADNLPFTNPEMLFDTEQYLRHGNMFWPDYWTGPNQYVLDKLPEDQAPLFEFFNLDYDETIAALMNNSKSARPESESGQVVIDTVRHAQALDYAWWLNSNGPTATYRLTWGDKETYKIAFALAGKANQYYQVPIPPGLALRPDRALELKPPFKSKLSPQPGLKLLAELQFSPDGEALFMHRTASKWQPKCCAPRPTLFTGPYPASGVSYWLAVFNTGPFLTNGFFVPEGALLQFTVKPANTSENATGECDRLAHLVYSRLRRAFVPLPPDPVLSEQCMDLAPLPLPLNSSEPAPEGPAAPSARFSSALLAKARDIRPQIPDPRWEVPVGEMAPSPEPAVVVDSVPAYVALLNAAEAAHGDMVGLAQLMPTIKGGLRWGRTKGHNAGALAAAAAAAASGDSGNPYFLRGNVKLPFMTILRTRGHRPKQH